MRQATINESVKYEDMNKDVCYMIYVEGLCFNLMQSSLTSRRLWSLLKTWVDVIFLRCIMMTKLHNCIRRLRGLTR